MQDMRMVRNYLPVGIHPSFKTSSQMMGACGSSRTHRPDASEIAFAGLAQNDIRLGVTAHRLCSSSWHPWRVARRANKQRSTPRAASLFGWPRRGIGALCYLQTLTNGPMRCIRGNRWEGTRSRFKLGSVELRVATCLNK
jgi:hypothetical protein